MIPLKETIMKVLLAFLSILISLALAHPGVASETKDIVFTFKNADKVVFSHDYHLKLGNVNGNCRMCHNAIFDIRKKQHYTMQQMEKTKGCGACHSGVKAFSVADEKSCVRCHKGKPQDVVFKAKGIQDAVFSHTLHIAKAGGKCKSCHNGKTIIPGLNTITMAQMEKGQKCGVCHNGKGAFTAAANCGKCHKGMDPKEITFAIPSKKATPAVFSHKLHLGMDYKCSVCHTRYFPFKSGSLQLTMADMESGKGCGACHNDKDAFTVAGECIKCHPGYTPGTMTFTLPDSAVGPAVFSHEIHLGMYKCPECHVKVFPFKHGVKHFGMGAMAEGKSCGTCHNGKDAFATTGDCNKCHQTVAPAQPAKK